MFHPGRTNDVLLTLEMDFPILNCIGHFHAKVNTPLLMFLPKRLGAYSNDKGMDLMIG